MYVDLSCLLEQFDSVIGKRGDRVHDEKILYCRISFDALASSRPFRLRLSGGPFAAHIETPILFVES
jgi:hypothetical protein